MRGIMSWFHNYGTDDESNKLSAIELTVELLERILPMEEGTRVVRVFNSQQTGNALTVVVCNDRFGEVAWGDRIPTVIPTIKQGEHGELEFVEWLWPGRSD